MREPVRFRGALRLGLAGLAAATLLLPVQVKVSAQQNNEASAKPSPTASQRQFLDRYCASCHNDRLKTGGLSLGQVDLSKPGAQPEIWEKVLRKLSLHHRAELRSAGPMLVKALLRAMRGARSNGSGPRAAVAMRKRA